MSWDRRHEALLSPETRALSHAVRVAISPRDLTLLVLVNGSVGQRIPLHGNTISQVESTLKSALAATGLDGRRYSLRRHFELPEHPVARGQAFDTAKQDDFAEFAAWYGNAAAVLGELRSRVGGSDVRCWPHHFDVATLATIAPGRTVGSGLSPGDETYPEPYFYVNAYPSPSNTSLLPELGGQGTWNTDGWVGAVLPGSRLDPDATAQASQVHAFLDSAVEACTKLVTA
jgi:hypothetical protein